MKLKNKQIDREILTDKAASRIAKGILKSQNVFAKYMESFTKGWKGKHQWIFLCVVCIFFGGLSIAAIIYPFKTNKDNSITVPRSIAVPKNIHRQSNGTAITENEFRQVQAYIQTHPSLQKEHPGLFDSLNMIEEIYYSQKK